MSIKNDRFWGSGDTVLCCTPNTSFAEPLPVPNSTYCLLHFPTVLVLLNQYKGTEGARVQMLFGYARVSTQDQNLHLQLDALKQYGAERIYEEEMTGTKRERPQLDAMIGQLRPGVFDSLKVPHGSHRILPHQTMVTSLR